MPGTAAVTSFNGLAPPWSLASLDTNFTNINTLLASFNNYGNYLVDTGAANAYVVTAGAGQVVTLAAGLPVQFKAVNANTGPSTLNVNGSGIKNIFNADGSALGAGQIPANSIVSVMYDGAQYLLLSAVASGWIKIQSQTAAASATLNFTAGINSAFGEFLVSLVDVIPATDNTDLFVRVSEDGGGTYKQGATDYRWARFLTSDIPGSGSTGSTGDTKFSLAAGLGNVGNRTFNCEFRFFSPSGTAKNKQATWDWSYVASGANTLYRGIGAGAFVLDTNAINAIQFAMTAGNLTSGKFTLYGLAGS